MWPNTLHIITITLLGSFWTQHIILMPTLACFFATHLSLCAIEPLGGVVYAQTFCLGALLSLLYVDYLTLYLLQFFSKQCSFIQVSNYNVGVGVKHIGNSLGTGKVGKRLIEHRWLIQGKSTLHTESNQRPTSCIVVILYFSRREWYEWRRNRHRESRWFPGACLSGQNLRILGRRRPHSKSRKQRRISRNGGKRQYSP